MDEILRHTYFVLTLQIIGLPLVIVIIWSSLILSLDEPGSGISLDDLDLNTTLVRTISPEGRTFEPIPLVHRFNQEFPR